MKHLIIGAGATLAEAKELGVAGDLLPPTMKDFARKTWANFSPHPLLELYLADGGHTDWGRDPRELFYKLESEGKENIERFMEYCWKNRNIEFPEPGKREYWKNFLYHGIGAAFHTMMVQCFYKDGAALSDLALSKKMASNLQSGDLVLNLNYDTVFELALEQSGRTFRYAPNKVNDRELLICKPHGSLNMVSDENGFTFGQPEFLGMPQPIGLQSYLCLMPPRLNKQYHQHPTSKIIVDSVRERSPQAMIFWGVGFTESDTDLVELFQQWAKQEPDIVVINPDATVAKKVQDLLGFKVRHFNYIHMLEMER